MAYTPIDIDDTAAGMLASSTVWHTLTDNHDECYELYEPVIAACAVDVQIDATSATTVLRFQMPANEDNEDLAVRVRWKMDSGPTNITMTVLVDSSSIGTITTTSTSYTDQTLTGTPTGTGTREVEIQLHRTGGSAGNKAYIEAVSLYLAAAAPAGGTLSSGFIRADSGWYTADQPIPSERVARLLNGPVLIARDRPAAALTMAQDLEGGGGRAMVVDSTSYEITYRMWLPSLGKGAQQVRLYIYLDQVSTGVPDALVEIGAATWNPTGVGWANTTAWAPVGGGWITVQLKRSSGSGAVFVGTLQAWREPG